MNEFTVLTRPEPSQVSIEAKECPSDGFNYPTIRLLNKQGRVALSSHPLTVQPSYHYRLFATSNSKGWFAAGISSSLIFSPLPELRLAFKSTSTPFSPQRTLPLSQGATPTFIAFASADTRLLVAFDAGQLAVYDTSSLFTPGSENIQPLHFVETHAAPFRQIAPNPGTELDIFAVVRSDGCVQLFNTNLESQGGWVGSDIESTPVTVAWSPKGKHLALGLHSGDILTFLPSSSSSPQKHIPRTTSAPLVSLSWLAPGHTFRTSYAPAPQSVDPVQHTLFLDTKSSSLTYAAPNHPFVLPDRTQQAFVLALPRWDEDSTSTAESQKTLLVVADKSSTDIEILGSSGPGQWHQQWQENQLALPLDKTTSEDTVLLALDVDLTDTGADGTPVMYAFLNDGTLEGWFLESTKPYTGMVRSASVVAAPFKQPTPPSPFAPSNTASAFAKPASTTVFSQPAFGSSGFGSTTGFGQTSPTFGQPSTFGQQSQPTLAPAFGKPSQPTSAFGAFPSTPSAFGGASSTPGAFGSGAFGGTPSAFGGTASIPSAFGSSSSADSPFGKPSNAFSSFATSNTNVFGQTGFGFNSSAPNTLSPPSPPTAPDMSREASMSDDTSSFGGLSLTLGDSNESNTDITQRTTEQKTGVFGSFSPPAAPTTTTTFGGGGISKPAAGFGAFSHFQTSTSGAGSGTVAEQQKPTPSPAFGQSSFGKPGSGFGQSGFGQTGFGGKPGAVTGTGTGAGAGGGAFSAFAGGGATGFSGKGAFGSGNGGGFNAFASGAPSAFGQQQQQQRNESTTSTSTFTPPEPSKSPFPPPALGAPPFGTRPQPSSSSFRESSPLVQEVTPQTPVKSLTVPVSPSSSPDASPLENEKPEEAKDATPFTPTPSPFGPNKSTGAFGNITTTPSAFKPASGFGAFGSDVTPTSSPFFKPSTNTSAGDSPAPAFATASSTPPQPASQSQASPTPAFGAPSSLGFNKSTFPTPTPSSVLPAPVGVPSVGGFDAFSKGGGGFSAFVGKGKSFGELLKIGDGGKGKGKQGKEKEEGDSVKPSLGGVSVFGKEKENVKGGDPVKPSTGAGPVFRTVKENEETEEGVEVGKGTTAEPAKPTMAWHEKLSTNAEKATTKSPTPEAATPKIASKPVFGSAEEPSKSVFTPSKTPIPVSPPISLGDKGAATPSSKVKKEVPSPESTPKPPFVFSPPPKDASSSGDETKGKGVKEESSATTSADTSFGNLSMLSETSSFVEVEGERGSTEESPSGSESDDGEQGDDLESEDESSASSSFLSESYVPSDESSSEDQGSDEEDGTRSPEPTAIPLPASRSPSATPQPELPAIQVTPSPSDSPEPGVLPTIPEEESTTPPGTPTKEPLFRKSPSPAPASTGTPTPLFGVGLSRPSTRPARSSPLASTPVSLEDEDEQPQEVVAPAPQIPASPKPRFAVLPMPPPSPEKAEAEESSKVSANKTLPPRPKTPPPLLSFGGAKPSTTPATPAPGLSTPPPKAASAPPAPPSFSLFGKAASPPVFGVPPNANNQVAPAKSSAPSSSPGLFSKSNALPPVTPGATPAFGLFGTSSPQGTPATAQTTPTPAGTGFNLGSFNWKGSTPTTPASPVPNSLFGSPSLSASKPIVTPAPPATPSSPAVKPSPQPVVAMEEGMQKECATLFFNLNKELEELRLLAQRAKEKRLEFGKSNGGSRKKADLGDVTKWNLGDVVQFGQVLRQYEADLSTLKELRDAQYQALRELQSNMLKAGTRREEIKRFNKAKNDSEFAKMLKARTLGPEHLETQTQLRRNIRAMRDRIQKLEDHLNASKKKLAQVNSGKPSFRAPSLDTINRTYRNIDIAIQQQADDVTKLTSRISKLTIKSSRSPKLQYHPTRDARLPDAIVSRRPYNVTPHVAATTAAALNAERSAHKLKRALLAARKEPLLNTKATTALPPPSGFKTPQKASLARSFGTGKSSLFPAARGPVADPTAVPVPDWTLPEDNFNPSTPPAARRGAGVTKRQHMSVPLKKSGGSPGPSPPAPAASFDWGPLPVFEQTQGTTMVEAIRLTPPSSKPLAGGSSFGGWNVGLFGKKGT